MKRVLVLKHAWEVPVGAMGLIMDTYAIPYDVINVEEETLPDPIQYTAILVLGGPQHLYQAEHYPYIAQELAFIRTVLDMNISFLGICLGGQLLALALKASIKKHTMSEIGFYDVQLTNAGLQDPLLAGLPTQQKVFHWHSDVFDLPSGATLLATHQNAAHQAFRIGQRAYGLQYHIELNDSMLDTWLYHPDCRKDLLETIGEEGLATIEQDRTQCFTTYQDHSQNLFKNFLHLSALING